MKGLAEATVQMGFADLKADKGKIGKSDIQFGFGMVAQIMRGQFCVSAVSVMQERRSADQAKTGICQGVTLITGFSQQ